MNKNTIARHLNILKTILAILMVTFLSISLFSACKSADATSKEEKSKKSKSQKVSEEEEEEDSETVSKKESEESNSSESKESEPKKKSEEKKDKSETEKKVDPELIWADLMKGNKRFMAGKHTTINYNTSRLSLTKGQKPEVIILGCADSRVPPEFVFDKNLGELFVIRVAGSIADAAGLGSIEYAVEHLHSKMIVVLGHESCGAVAAAVSGEKMPTKNLRAITESIAPAFEGSKTCLIGSPSNASCVELNTQHSSKDLLLKSSIIKEAVEKGEVTIISAVYDFDTGEVVRLK